MTNSGSAAGHGARPAYVLVAAAAALAPPLVAHADPLGGEWITWLYAALMFLAALVLYEVAVWLIEALVLRLSLQERFRRCLGYSALMNVTSLIFGFELGAVFGWTEGWKTALISGHSATVMMLFLRSFALAFVVEGAILWLFVRKRYPLRTIAGSSLLANGATYVLAVPLVFLRLLQRG
jgi:hypothetical protein